MVPTRQTRALDDGRCRARAAERQKQQQWSDATIPSSRRRAHFQLFKGRDELWHQHLALLIASLCDYVRAGWKQVSQSAKEVRQSEIIIAVVAAAAVRPEAPPLLRLTRSSPRSSARLIMRSTKALLPPARLMMPRTAMVAAAAAAAEACFWTVRVV